MGYFQDKLDKLQKAKSIYGDDKDLSPALVDNPIIAPAPEEKPSVKTKKYNIGSGKHYQNIDPDVTRREQSYGSKEDVWTPLTQRTRIGRPITDEMRDKVWSEAGKQNQEQNMLMVAELSKNTNVNDWKNGFMSKNPEGGEWNDTSKTPEGYNNSKERAMYALNNTSDYKTMKSIGKNPTTFFGVLKDISVLKEAKFTDEEIKKINNLMAEAQKASDVNWGVYWDKDRQAVTPEVDLLTEDVGGSYSERQKPIYTYEFDEDVQTVSEEGSSAYYGEITGEWRVRRTPVNITDDVRKDKLTTNEVYTSKEAYDNRVMEIREVQYNTAKKTGNMDVFLNNVQDIKNLPFVSEVDKKLFYQNKLSRGRVSVEEAITGTGGKPSDFKLSYKQKHNYYRDQVIGGFMTKEEASKSSGISVKDLDLDVKKPKKKKLFGLF